MACCRCWPHRAGHWSQVRRSRNSPHLVLLHRQHTPPYVTTACCWLHLKFDALKDPPNSIEGVQLFVLLARRVVTLQACPSCAPPDCKQSTHGRSLAVDNVDARPRACCRRVHAALAVANLEDVATCLALTQCTIRLLPDLLHPLLLAGAISAQQHAGSAAAATPPRPTFAHSAATAAPARGAELGLPTDFEDRFAEGALLGVGSFGTVHLATCRTSGREVAVKKLRKDLPRGLHLTRGTGR